MEIGKMLVEEFVIPRPETKMPPVSRMWTYQKFFRDSSPSRGISVTSVKEEFDEVQIKFSVHLGDDDISLIQAEVYKPMEGDSDLPNNFGNDVQGKLRREGYQFDMLGPDGRGQAEVRKFLNEFQVEYNRRRDDVPTESDHAEPVLARGEA